MSVTFLGVRHHSPACARLVARTIDQLKPAYVLIEGPADLNQRIDELLLGHDLPVAVFTSYRDEQRRHGSWAPFCEYSPEWVALTHGRAAGAELRFIDLPAWHPAFVGIGNRYADAELRYAEVLERLCRNFEVDNVDVLWDHLVEIAPAHDLADRLVAYFDLVRGETVAGEGDADREAYMAQWVEAAAEKGDVVVVTGGFHRPALVAAQARAENAVRAGVKGYAEVGDENFAQARSGNATQAQVENATRARVGNAAQARVESTARAEAGSAGETGTDSSAQNPVESPAEAPVENRAGQGAAWPEVPALPEGALGGSYLVPYSFRRLDSFDGYQSGMPSPAYYQALWERGPEGAAQGLVEAVAGRLRQRRQPVSTADLIAARATAEGLATIRGHEHPARADVLDGLASALVTDALEVPLPWTARGTLHTGSHPVVVEMIAALSGTRVGRLHPNTPAPPLVHDLEAELERAGLRDPGEHDLDLTRAADAERSRLLHRVRVLGVPGVRRERGPRTGRDPVLREHWRVKAHPDRLTAVIEAGAYGATLADASAAMLTERAASAGRDVDRLAEVLFDAALTGLAQVSDETLDLISRTIAVAPEPGPLGKLLAVALTMWRHDEVFGTARSPMLGTVLEAATRRILWLVEGIHGGPAPAEPARIGALVACRDAVRHAGAALSLDVAGSLEIAARVAAQPSAPPDLRGAAFGFRWSLAADDLPDPVRVVRGAFLPPTAGDWLAGLFALAREEVLHDEAVLALLDDLISAMGADDFLIAVPALRQAFEFFPPRERALLAERLLARRGLGGSARVLLRDVGDPALVAAGMLLDERVEMTLRREGLIVEGRS